MPRSGVEKWAEAQRDRNYDIVAAKHRGMSYRQVAQSFDLSIERIKAIVGEWRASNPSLRSRPPEELLDEILEGHQAAIEELAFLSASTKHDAVRVSAIKARLDAMRTVVEILQATGNLPHDLGELHVRIDQRIVAARFTAVFDRLGVPDEVADALLEALGTPAGG